MNEFLIVAGVHLMAVMSPRPDFIRMLRSSLVYSRKTALWSAADLELSVKVAATS